VLLIFFSLKVGKTRTLPGSKNGDDGFRPFFVAAVWGEIGFKRS
jgi:hypothetical protein